MKTDSMIDADEIKVSPRLVSRLLQTRSGEHNSRATYRLAPPDEDDAFDAALMFAWVRPAPRVYLGCVGKMPRGKCFNAPIGEDLCYLHEIARYLARWQRDW